MMTSAQLLLAARTQEELQIEMVRMCIAEAGYHPNSIQPYDGPRLGFTFVCNNDAIPVECVGGPGSWPASANRSASGARRATGSPIQMAVAQPTIAWSRTAAGASPKMFILGESREMQHVGRAKDVPAVTERRIPAEKLREMRSDGAAQKAATKHRVRKADVLDLVLGTEREQAAARRRLRLDGPSLDAIKATYRAELEQLSRNAARTRGTTRPAAPKKYCMHRISPANKCPVCNQHRRSQQVVYMSDGGTRFHRTRDCSALRSGQQRVEDRGGTPSKISGVKVTSNRLFSRQGCGTCEW